MFAYNRNTHKREVLQSLATPATGFEADGQPAGAGDGSILGTTENGGEPLCSADPQQGCGSLFRDTYTPDTPTSPGTK